MLLAAVYESLEFQSTSRQQLPTKLPLAQVLETNSLTSSLFFPGGSLG